jgi:hypothetical protein
MKANNHKAENLYKNIFYAGVELKLAAKEKDIFLIKRWIEFINLEYSKYIKNESE